MLACQKDKFSLNKGTHYLNNAYMSPMLRSVEEVGIDTMRIKRDPSDIRPEDFFYSCNELRAQFAKLIGGNDQNSIAIFPSVSYGIGNVANNIEFASGDEIVILGEQFPSNVYPWREKAKKVGAKVVVVEAPPSSENSVQVWNQRIMDAINAKTKVVAMGQVHWTDGVLFDLKAIGDKIHSIGGYLVIDGTQSIGAMPFNIEEIKPDVLICAGYKWLLGPYGITLGYYNERFNHGEPIEYSWITRVGSENFSGLANYVDHYQPGAQRYDSGERSSFINVAMQLASLKHINEWGTQNIQDYAQSISSNQINELRAMGFRIEAPEHRGHHLFGVRLNEDQDPQIVAQVLSSKNIKVSVRGTAVRISINVYNTTEDITAFVECLKSLQ